MRIETILLATAVAVLATPSLAADHLDGPAAKAEPTADVADLYAWMTADATKVNLVTTLATNLAPGATFSDAVVYAFHVSSTTALGGTEVETLIRCKFWNADRIECWAGADEYVEGDPSATAGITSTSGKLKVFAGERNDPFFFNLEGFNATVDLVVAAAPSLDFDDEGCPAVDAPTSTALVGQLQSAADGGPAVDFFAGTNLLALVVQVDKSVVTPGGPILAVWTSTHSVN